MTQPPLIILHSDKRSIVQAQYCSKRTELWYDTLVQFLCSEMTQPELCELIILFKYLLFDRLSKNRQEEENTITFRLEYIVIA